MAQWLTKDQINRKYRDKYVEIYQEWDLKNRCWKYQVLKVYKTIHENTTLGQDVGTNMEFRR